jgi:hypothetical protein
MTVLQIQKTRLFCLFISRVHISESTLLNLGNEFDVEIGNGHERNDYIAKLGIKTYFIIPRDVPNTQHQLMMK